MLSSGEGSIRHEAALRLAGMKSTKAIPILLKLLKDDSAEGISWAGRSSVSNTGVRDSQSCLLATPVAFALYKMRIEGRKYFEREIAKEDGQGIEGNVRYIYALEMLLESNKEVRLENP